MATATKSTTSMLSLQALASGAVVKSSAEDVSTKFEGAFYLRLGRRATSALTAAFKFRVEGSTEGSGDGSWYTLAAFSSEIAASESEAVSGTVNAGTDTITVASTTNLVVGDRIFIENGTFANSEFGLIYSVTTNTNVKIIDNLENAQTGGTIFDQAQEFVAHVPFGGVKRVRVVADASGTGQNVAVEAVMITLDAIA
jgi:hypothetical protein